MDVIATLAAPCAPDELFAIVADLDTYPRWLDIVPRVVAADGEGDEPAWTVDLRGRLGPFARAKRLRMVRTALEPPSRVVFERAERDGRTHSPWRLEADVDADATGEGSTLTMRLHYGGKLWGPLVERLLADEIEHSRPRLLALL